VGVTSPHLNLKRFHWPTENSADDIHDELFLIIKDYVELQTYNSTENVLHIDH
jgi:hypothetical protein